MNAQYLRSRAPAPGVPQSRARMYRYPNQEHYLNSLQRGAMLDQHVVGPEGQQLFVTKRGGVRRAVKYDPNRPKNPKQKVYTGAVVDEHNHIWYVNQGETGKIVHASAEHAKKYKAKIAKKVQGTQHQQGKPKGQGKGKQKHEPKDKKIEVKTTPYNVLDKTKNIIEHLRKLQKAAAAENSKTEFVTADKMKKGPYNFDALQSALQKFAHDYNASDKFFKGRNPAMLMGESVTEMGTKSIEHIIDEAEGHGESVSDQYKHLIHAFQKLQGNILGTVRGTMHYKSRMAKMASLADSVRKEAHVTGESLEDAVDNVTRKIIARGKDDTSVEDVDFDMKLDPQVLLRVGTELVKSLFSNLEGGESDNWVNFVALAGKRHKLIKFVMKHEAVFKKAVKSYQSYKFREAKKEQRAAARHVHTEADIHGESPAKPLAANERVSSRFVSMRCASPSLDDL